MKDLSDIQKQIIRNIIKIENNQQINVLTKILDEYFDISGNIYLLVLSENQCQLRIKTEYFENVTKKYNGINSLIFFYKNLLYSVIFLFEYLEKEQYIILTDEDNYHVIGVSDGLSKYISYDLLDIKINKSLLFYVQKRIIPTEFLRKIVNNNFKSDEEIRYENQFKITNKQIKNSTIQIKASIAQMRHNNRMFLITLISLAITTISIVIDKIYKYYETKDNNKPKEIIISTNTMIEFQSIISNNKYNINVKQKR